MGGHHLIMGELTDLVTGQTLPDTHDERYRQRFLASVEPILEEIERFKNTQLASIAYSNK